ncbi:thiol reductant ABC exporter subunit CydD, partial [Planococcus sp. SIMBA_143]
MKKVSEELGRESEEVTWGDRFIENRKTPPKIALKDVSYQYKDSGFSLSSLNITIEPYRQVAV